MDGKKMFPFRWAFRCLNTKFIFRLENLFVRSVLFFFFVSWFRFLFSWLNAIHPKGWSIYSCYKTRHPLARHGLLRSLDETIWFHIWGFHKRSWTQMMIGGKRTTFDRSVHFYYYLELVFQSELCGDAVVVYFDGLHMCGVWFEFALAFALAIVWNDWFLDQ